MTTRVSPTERSAPRSTICSPSPSGARQLGDILEEVARIGAACCCRPRSRPRSPSSSAATATTPRRRRGPGRARATATARPDGQDHRRRR